MGPPGPPGLSGPPGKPVNSQSGLVNQEASHLCYVVFLSAL